MKRSVEFLKEAKEKLGCESDYALAKALKTSHANISNYVNGKTLMDDYHCIRVAQVLGIDPMRIIAAAQEEREKNPEKQGFWRDFRQARERESGRAFVPVIAAIGGLMMMALLSLPTLTSAAGNGLSEAMSNIYYVKYRKEKWETGVTPTEPYLIHSCLVMMSTSQHKPKEIGCSKERSIKQQGHHARPYELSEIC